MVIVVTIRVLLFFEPAHPKSATIEVSPSVNETTLKSNDLNQRQGGTISLKRREAKAPAPRIKVVTLTPDQRDQLAVRKYLEGNGYKNFQFTGSSGSFYDCWNKTRVGISIVVSGRKKMVMRV